MSGVCEIWLSALLSPSTVQSFTRSSSCLFPGWLCLTPSQTPTLFHISPSLTLSRLMPVVLSRVFEFFLSLPPVLLTSSVLLPSYISSDFASSCTICTLISPPFSHYPGPLLFFWLSLSAASERNFPLILKPCNNFMMLSFLFVGPCQRREILFIVLKVMCAIKQFLHSNKDNEDSVFWLDQLAVLNLEERVQVKLNRKSF